MFTNYRMKSISHCRILKAAQSVLVMGVYRNAGVSESKVTIRPALCLTNDDVAQLIDSGRWKKRRAMARTAFLSTSTARNRASLGWVAFSYFPP